MSHLSYGVLSAMYPEWFKSDLMAASLSVPITPTRLETYIDC